MYKYFLIITILVASARLTAGSDLIARGGEDRGGGDRGGERGEGDRGGSSEFQHPYEAGEIRGYNQGVDSGGGGYYAPQPTQPTSPYNVPTNPQNPYNYQVPEQQNPMNPYGQEQVPSYNPV